MEKLAELDGNVWREKKAQYDAASQNLVLSREACAEITRQIESLRAQANETTVRALKLEAEKGEAFRREIAPLRTRLFDIQEVAARRLNPLGEDGKPRRLNKEERTAQNEAEKNETLEIQSLRERIAAYSGPRAKVDIQISALRDEVRQLKTQANSLVAQRVEMEKSESLRAARDLREALENEAELHRFFLVRDAILASDGLRYTNYRPTAWWLPMVSPDGKWFRNLTQSAQARIEAL
jgi:hypothetical protein